MSNFDYFKPQSPDEAWDLFKKFPGARYIAGGTDLMVKIKNREVKPPALISLRSITGLSGIETGEKTRIGAMTTITDLIDHPEAGRVFPVLLQAAERIGSVQVRNVGTVGGNLCNCSPCADTALALLVLDARAVLAGPGGSREVPLADFFLGPGKSCLSSGELLTELILDKPAPGTRAVFMKKGRVKMDLAIASVAVLLEMDGDTCKKACVAAGSVAPVPLRLKKVEELFRNAVITKELILEAQKIAMESVSPITDIRSTADYRRHIVGVYVKRAIEKLSIREVK
jgi:CO/xanthine dehydrogenase FAD-binding subunit